MRALAMLLHRDLRLGFRRPGELATPLLFFVMATVLFPLGLSPRPDLLAAVAPGVLWVTALLAGLIGQESLFKSDYEDGTLEQLLLASVPPELMALARVFSHWLTAGLPLVILSPLLGLMLDYPESGFGTLLLSLTLGTLILSLLGAVGAALTVGLRQSSMLLPVLVMPLSVPVLIFGAQACAQAARGEDPAAALYLLGAMLALSVTLAPFAIAGALRISLES